MKLDVLAFGAHPDDVELSCSGTLMQSIEQGKKVGVVDLTRGELGTRGSAELRIKEASSSAKILGLSERINLNMADGFFLNDKDHQLKIIKQLRYYQPDVVLANAISDRHIDHGRGAALVADACFLSGLKKIETDCEGVKQNAWRPKVLYHYIQDHYLKPDFVVDVTKFWDRKIESIMAFSSQFYDPKSDQNNTPISSKEFMSFIASRAREFGRPIGATYAEGFQVKRVIGVNDITSLG